MSIGQRVLDIASRWRKRRNQFPPYTPTSFMTENDIDITTEDDQPVTV